MLFLSQVFETNISNYKFLQLACKTFIGYFKFYSYIGVEIFMTQNYSFRFDVRTKLIYVYEKYLEYLAKINFYLIS